MFESNRKFAKLIQAQDGIRTNFNDTQYFVDGCNNSRKKPSIPGQQKSAQRDGCHSVCGHSVKHYSNALLFLPFYPRPMIPIISIRTILWHFFAFICYFRSQFLFFLFFRVRFVVIRRGQKLSSLKLLNSKASRTIKAVDCRLMQHMAVRRRSSRIGLNVFNSFWAHFST